MKDYKYRSGLEERIAKDLHDQGIAFDYEERRVKYLLSEHRSYKPDFELPNGIIIEAKGRFKPEDRKKHLLIVLVQIGVISTGLSTLRKRYHLNGSTNKDWLDE